MVHHLETTSIPMQRMPRLPLPCIGNAGILYNSPLLDRNRWILKAEAESCTGSPEFIKSSSAFRKGAFGGYKFRFYSTSVTVEDIKKAEKERETKNKFKLKTAQTIKIMLVSETGSLTAVTLDEANKIAKKKGLHLVHIQNEREKPVRTEKEVYKLISKTATLEEDEDLGTDDTKPYEREKTKDKPKDLKTSLFKSNIGEHDAASKINVMKKWIQKGHRVRVEIGQAGDRGDAVSNPSWMF
ncbi:unnamed protein product [Orchesella dallaii]|uniref:Translation initiation factor IF-3 n=1 Tax=Orchesella dallaii TaxID=48710 RepID=A0ABP1PNG6_9HEXA